MSGWNYVTPPGAYGPTIHGYAIDMRLVRLNRFTLDQLRADPTAAFLCRVEKPSWPTTKLAGIQLAMRREDAGLEPYGDDD